MGESPFEPPDMQTVRQSRPPTDSPFPSPEMEPVRSHAASRRSLKALLVLGVLVVGAASLATATFLRSEGSDGQSSPGGGPPTTTPSIFPGSTVTVGGTSVQVLVERPGRCVDDPRNRCTNTFVRFADAAGRPARLRARERATETLLADAGYSQIGRFARDDGLLLVFEDDGAMTVVQLRPDAVAGACSGAPRCADIFSEPS
jgi:hypothetical protein